MMNSVKVPGYGLVGKLSLPLSLIYTLSLQYIQHLLLRFFQFILH